MKIDIVICTDTNYIMPCGILFYSICKNNLMHNIVFHAVIDDSVTKTDKEFLNLTVNQFNMKVEYHLVDGHLFDSFPNLGTGVYVSKATYYRLYLTEILPQSIDKILYLDCDMIVRKDIGPLWNIDVSDVAVGVSADGWESKIQIYNRLQYPYHKGYFNAGMLLINLRYWRENNVLGRCLDYIEHHFTRIVSHDQDVLNYVLQDEKAPVGITYNFLENFLYKSDTALFDYWKYKDEIDAVKNDPVIIHYVASKPWNKNCQNPYKDIFLQYKSETLWKGTPLFRHKVSIRSIIKDLLIIFKLVKPRKDFWDYASIETLHIV